jgi:pilus assembly protein Flp/PilA
MTPLRRLARDRASFRRRNTLQLVNEIIAKLMARQSDEQGQTMIEYGLIVALISIVAILTLTTVGGNIQDVFNSIAGKLHS